MPRLNKLQIHNLRNISALSLEPAAGFNLIHGANGSGKTSILEAIHLLGLGRSFRGKLVRPLIRDGENECSIHLRLEDGIALGLSKALNAKQQMRISGRNAVNAAELARVLPLQLVNSDTFRILEGSPSVRRAFMDWGVFHVEQSYLDAWRQMQRVLSQRNSLLKGQADEAALRPWTRELARLGELVTASRRVWLAEFLPMASKFVERLLPGLELRIEFDQGWPQEIDLGEALDRALGRDQRQGHSGPGPQRADLKIRSGVHLAAEVLSRGQEKLLVVALKLAQAALLQERRGQHCVFLVDDLPAELDLSNRALVCKELEALGSQVFVTCVEESALAACWSDGLPSRLFHVKHGKIV